MAEGKGGNPVTVKNLVISQAGGGFMGVGPARYLAELEGALVRLGYTNPGPVSREAALLVGTSVGAIDMALLSLGYTCRSVLDLHEQHGAEIFGTKLWPYRLLKNGPQFSDAYVLKLLEAKLGDVTMDHTPVPLYLTAWDARKKDLKVFGPGDVGVPVRYAVRCSMAASTYFSPMPGFSVVDGVFRLEEEGRYTDGGFSANDPLLVGMAAGVEDGLLDPASGWKLLELVTSGKNPEGGPISAGWNILKTLSRVVLPAITAGNSSDVGFVARAWSKSRVGCPDQLFRVCPESPDFDLAQVEKTAEVSDLWAAQWEKDAVRALEFFRT